MKLLVRHLPLLQTSAPLPRSAAEAAVQCSVLGAVEEIRDRVADEWPSFSLGAACSALKPLIQHSLGLNAGLVQGRCRYCSCHGSPVFAALPPSTESK